VENRLDQQTDVAVIVASDGLAEADGAWSAMLAAGL